MWLSDMTCAGSLCSNNSSEQCCREACFGHSLRDGAHHLRRPEVALRPSLLQQGPLRLQTTSMLNPSGHASGSFHSAPLILQWPAS